MVADPNQLQTARVLEEVRAERDRQRVGEGYSREHDDRHKPGELGRMGAAYALFASFSDAVRERLFTPAEQGSWTRIAFSRVWPWPLPLFKPKADRRRELVIGAACIVAEIEKIDRAEKHLREKPDA